MIKYTKHAAYRINERLAGMVSLSNVSLALQLKETQIPQNKSYVILKDVQYSEIYDPSVMPDGIARGDRIVAVCRRENNVITVVTVMLIKSWLYRPTDGGFVK